ncbi:cyclic nucleotide-binding domain-containing protein [Streptomyces sp. NPDC057910]|uniref:cyclic nucleotide-binding domain-containing protein n=1 Tax=Streptomyces sp. NPDC057910 TaxID=3346278 RepID=UPI0036EA2430
MVHRLIDNIRGLGTGSAVLHIGAHPDDEEGGMIALLSQKHAARVVYWSATRGEGGGNRRGPERAEALGLIRTWESLEARAVDGGEVGYGPFYDFGFSKSGADSLRRWGTDTMVREIVRAIRSVQPQVVVSRWSGTERDGHGHHQAVGMAAREAYEAAGDADRFPELGLPAWRASKLYRSMARDWQPGEEGAFGIAVEEYESAGCLRLDTGEVDPLTGLSYQEQAHRAVSHHRSQGIAFLPEPGPYLFYYRLEDSRVPVPSHEQDFFTGLDTGLTGLPVEGLPPSLRARERLAALAAAVDGAVAAFHPLDPAPTAHHLLPYLDGADELLADLARAEPAPVAAALSRFLGGLSARCHAVVAACLRLRVECRTGARYASPGETLRVDVRLWNGGKEPAGPTEVELAVPEGWSVRRSVRPDTTTTIGPAAVAFGFEVTIPEREPATTPYWLRVPRGPFAYAWPDHGPEAGQALGEPLVSAHVKVNVRSRPLALSADAVHRDTVPGGDRELRLTVLPQITVAPREQLAVIGRSEAEQVIVLDADVRCLGAAGGLVTLSVAVPAGWILEPASVAAAFSRTGESRSVRFELRVPGGTDAGDYELRYRMWNGQSQDAIEVSPVRIGPTLGAAKAADCVQEAHLVRPAVVGVRVVDAVFIRTLRYGYISGIDESIVATLGRFDIDITQLKDSDLQFGDLAAYSAIVVGPNAYNTRPAVGAYADRLLRYARDGGTLIVQHQTYGYDDPALLPWPARFHQPHDRVTDANAPVTVLQPEHPLLHVPNCISASDFDGWVHDRGLYFLGEWDRRYAPLLASHDADEPPSAGGLLSTSVGRGGYVYVAYSLFRQIPAGVPGAIRLFANLLGLADVRVRERAAQLAEVELFSTLTEEELYEAAKIVAERWVDAGTVLAHEGERGQEMFILLTGSIDVLKGQPGGEPRLLHVAEPGEILGEFTLLADIPRSASLRAATDSAVLVVRSDAFTGWLESQPGFSRRILAQLARKVVAKDAVP